MTELFTVKIQKLDEVNKNGRVYRTEDIERVLEKNNGADIVGTVGYSSTGRFVQDYTGIPIEDISHTVKNLRIEDGYLVGDVKVLETPRGNILNQLLEAGVEPTFRPMGYGNVQADGTVTDYTLISVSVVPADSAA